VAPTETGGKVKETYLISHYITQNQKAKAKLNLTCTISTTSLPKFTIYMVKTTLNINNENYQILSQQKKTHINHQKQRKKIRMNIFPYQQNKMTMRDHS
jgi:hypothetical protein